MTVSIGLARNRLLAKIAAGRDKPRGFCGDRRGGRALLAPRTGAAAAGHRPGAGEAAGGDGHHPARAVAGARSPHRAARLGDDGPALVARARGEDSRLVQPGRDTKSISAETTFETDLAAREDLERHCGACARKWRGGSPRTSSRPPASCSSCAARASPGARGRHAWPPRRCCPNAVRCRLPAAVARDGRNRLSPDRHRRRSAGARRGGRSARPRRSRRSRGALPPSRPWMRCAASLEKGPWCVAAASRADQQRDGRSSKVTMRPSIRKSPKSMVIPSATPFEK